jgi:hypothetical protein
VVLGEHREVLLRRVERRALRDGEALEGAADLQAQVVVNARRVVQVADEAALARFADAGLAFRGERLVGP